MTVRAELELAQFDGGVHDDYVGKIDGSALPACACIRGPVGDAFHFGENLLIETVHEERGCRGARQVPALVLAFGIQFSGAARHVLRDLFGHQMPVLISALVRLAFYVKVDPSAHRIAISGTVSTDSGGSGPWICARRIFYRNPGKPRLSSERSAVCDREHDAVLRARRGEPQMDLGPIARAGQRFRLDVEWQGRHAKRGAGGDGRTAQVADGELVGPDPAGEFICFANRECDRRGLNAGIAIRAPRFQAHRHLAFVGDGWVGDA